MPACKPRPFSKHQHLFITNQELTTHWYSPSTLTQRSLALSEALPLIRQDDFVSFTDLSLLREACRASLQREYDPSSMRIN